MNNIFKTRAGFLANTETSFDSEYILPAWAHVIASGDYRPSEWSESLTTMFVLMGEVLDG